MKYILLVVVLLIAAAPVAVAEEPVVGSIQFLYENAKRNVLEAAEKADPSIYGFKPAEETRTLAQQLTHIADANFLFCSTSLGTENPHPGAGPGAQGELELSKTKKPDIIAALKTSFTYCDEAFSKATDEALSELVELETPDGAAPVPRAAVLTLAAYHGGQHYGSIATYFRLNGLVPPSTERDVSSSESTGNK